MLLASCVLLDLTFVDISPLGCIRGKISQIEAQAFHIDGHVAFARTLAGQGRISGEKETMPGYHRTLRGPVH